MNFEHLCVILYWYFEYLKLLQYQNVCLNTMSEHCQASFLGSFLRSQKWSLTISCTGLDLQKEHVCMGSLFSGGGGHRYRLWICMEITSYRLLLSEANCMLKLYQTAQIWLTTGHQLFFFGFNKPPYFIYAGGHSKNST